MMEGNVYQKVAFTFRTFQRLGLLAAPLFRPLYDEFICASFDGAGFFLQPS
jgi:hypothetical protein